MVIVLLANGFEELEALTPVDVLRRNNIDVRTVSITNEKLITGTHGIQVATDLIASDVPLTDIDMLILPGGMPGVKNLDASPITKIFIDATLKNGGHLAAICAAPIIFGKHGMLTNIKATCFPGFECEMFNAILSDKNVVTDGVFTTAKDYLAAVPFANELVKVCDILGIKPHDGSDEIEIVEEIEYEEEEEIFSLEDFIATLGAGKEEEEEAKPDFFQGVKIISAGELTDEDIADVNDTAEKIIATLDAFSVKATVESAERGPRLTRYAVVPKKGVKVNSITNLYRDVALNIAREGIRMEAPIPGKSAVGFEIPNKSPKVVRLGEITATSEFTDSASTTTVALGKDIAGAPIIADISKFPHAIISGATGMGKSVCINSILSSLICKASPEDVRFILIDPKKVEFNMYAGLPHLLHPVITEPKNSAAALSWAISEMERRYDLIERLGVRNLDAYNEKVRSAPVCGKPEPKIVIVIDELADLMMTVRGVTEDAIMRIAQKARAAGIHLIIGTQRPSVAVITGAIKANIPTRITCKLTSQVDSRTILDMSGAEQLLNCGDMLYWPVTHTQPLRMQGAFISDTEIEELVESTKARYTAEYSESLASSIATFTMANKSESEHDPDDTDALGTLLGDKTFLDAIDVALSSEKLSTSLLQRKLSIGYGKAAKFIDAMEEIGIISEPEGSKPRKVLMSREEWGEKLKRVLKD